MTTTRSLGLCFALIALGLWPAWAATAGDYQLRAKADEPVVVLDKDTGRMWLLKSEAGSARMVPVFYDDGSGNLSATPSAATPATLSLSEPKAEPAEDAAAPAEDAIAP